MRFPLPTFCLLLTSICGGSAAAGGDRAAPARFRVSAEQIEPLVAAKHSEASGTVRPAMTAPKYQLQRIPVDTPAAARFRLLGSAAPKSAGDCAQDELFAHGFEG